MELSFGLSPCPNDTFIFDSLLQNTFKHTDLRFKPVFADVQQLNEWALEGRLDISKISYSTLFSIKNEYDLLRAGSALGKGVGPLLISNNPAIALQDDFSDTAIAIPGWNTTAHMLLNFAYPEASNKTSMVFSDIENAVLSDKYPLGVIIHENRFTYFEKGLHLVKDLGAFWEAKTNAPIPLGGIVARKSLGATIQKEIEQLIRESLAISQSHYPQLSTFVTAHAQEMEPAIMRKHIELYVNEYTVDLGTAGEAALNIMEKYSKFQK